MNSNNKTEKPWGYFINLIKEENYLAKIIYVNKGQKLSLQSHEHRSEHWFVISGTARVILKDKEITLNKGQSIDIPLKAKHSLQNPYDVDLVVIEIQQGDLLSEDDIIRYEDMYGRI